MVENEGLVDISKLHTVKDLENADIIAKPVSDHLDEPMIVLDVNITETELGRRTELLVTFDNKRKVTLFTFSDTLATIFERVKEEGFLPLKCVVTRKKRMLTIQDA